MVTCCRHQFGRIYPYGIGLSCMLVLGMITSTMASHVLDIPGPGYDDNSEENPVEGEKVELVKARYDEQEHKSVRNIVIAVCVTVGLLLLMILIAVIMCIIFRKKISNIIFAAECEPQNAPGSVFYSPRQFHHRGALQIKKVAPFDPKAQFADEKDNNPQNARFQFTEDQNEVFDIGSEVEQVIE